MKYLQNNINFVLLGLVVLIIISFAGFTVYYERTFTNLTTDYNTKITRLDELTQQLQSEKSRLNATSQELQLKQARESTLQEQYGDLRGRNEQLEHDMAVLREDYNSKIARLFQVENEVTTIQAQLQAAEETYTREINSLISDKSYLQNQLEACQN